MGLLAGQYHKDAVLGDMEEIYSARGSRHQGRMHHWYWQQILWSTVPIIAARLAPYKAYCLRLAVCASVVLGFVILWDVWAAQQAGWRLSAHIFGAARLPALGVYLMVYLVGCFTAGGCAAIAWRFRAGSMVSAQLSLKAATAVSLIAVLPVMMAGVNASGDVLALRMVQTVLGSALLVLGAGAAQWLLARRLQSC